MQPFGTDAYVGSAELASDLVVRRRSEQGDFIRRPAVQRRRDSELLAFSSNGRNRNSGPLARGPGMHKTACHRL